MSSTHLPGRLHRTREASRVRGGSRGARGALPTSPLRFNSGRLSLSPRALS